MNQFCLCFILLLVLPLEVFSEENAWIHKTGTNQSMIKKSTFQVTFLTDFLFFNNADFQSYRQKQFEDNQAFPYKNTDDKSYFVYSMVSLEYKAEMESSYFVAELIRYGYWGNDNLEGKDEGKNSLCFGKLYFVYFFQDNLFLSLGRQSFSIGHSTHDYFFFDTIDGLKINWMIAKNCVLEWMGDILGIASKPETYLYSTEKDSEQMKDFQGETLSLRTGLTLSFSFIEFFCFYLKYGANSQGGADRAENGMNTINRPDGDFLTLSGIRLYSSQSKLGDWDWTFSYSYGKDYQSNGVKVYQGFSSALNYSRFFSENWKMDLSLGYFSPGFCSMKGASMGGLLLYNNKGYFPSAYAGSYHFKDYDKKNTPTSIDITHSKSFSKIKADFIVSPIEISLSILALWETEQNTQWAYMGCENELSFQFKLRNLIFWLRAAVYFPSGYYLQKHQKYPYLPDGKNPFYGLNLGCSYFFGN